MSALLLPERLLSPQPTPQAALPLASFGVQRYVWESRYGPMLIEVIGSAIYVNGQPVEPHTPQPSP